MNMYCLNCGNLIVIDTYPEDGFIICPNCKASNRIPAEYIEQIRNIKIGKKPISSFPNIWQAILLAVSIYIMLFILYIPVIIIDIDSEIGLVKNAFIDALITLLGFGIVLFVGFKISKRPFIEVFPLKRFNFSITIPLLLMVAGTTILLSDVDNLVRTFLPAPEWLLEIFVDLFDDPLKALTLAVIVAPLTEESLCRGLILHGFLKNYSTNKAVIASAIIFMFMHLNPWQFAGAFFYGILFAWLLIKTKSLWPCLIGHGFANFMPLLTINILGLKIPGFSEGTAIEVVQQPWWFDLIGLILAIIGFIWLKNLFDNMSEYQHSTSQVSAN